MPGQGTQSRKRKPPVCFGTTRGGKIKSPRDLQTRQYHFCRGDRLINVRFRVG
jgi:hypothetical protein